jgi:hypothetical protein
MHAHKLRCHPARANDYWEEFNFEVNPAVFTLGNQMPLLANQPRGLKAASPVSSLCGADSTRATLVGSEVPLYAFRLIANDVQGAIPVARVPLNRIKKGRFGKAWERLLRPAGTETPFLRR